MVLRPAARYAFVFLSLLALLFAGYVAYEVHAATRVIEDFEYSPRPGSAEPKGLDGTLVGDIDLAALTGAPTENGTGRVGEVPPWISSGPRHHASVCDGEWKAGCEPPRWCDGTTTAASLKPLPDDAHGARTELTITRIEGMDFNTRTECTTTLRPHAGDQLRVQVDTTGVVVFDRTPESFITWQYDLRCDLVGTRVLPRTALQADPVSYRGLLLPNPSPRAGTDVHFRITDLADEDGCGKSCTLQIHESPYDWRRSEHELVAPRDIATGSNADYVWWTYWNGREWFFSVIDRDTHEQVMGLSGEHSNLRSTPPVSGVRIDDGRLTIRFEWLRSKDVWPQQEARVFELPAGRHVATVTDEGMPGLGVLP